MKNVDSLVEEIRLLPVDEQLLLLGKTIETLRSARTLDLQQATEKLLKDYSDDTELTSFTAIDCDDFYEAK